jgi:hypothetical protein
MPVVALVEHPALGNARQQVVFEVAPPGTAEATSGERPADRCPGLRCQLGCREGCVELLRGDRDSVRPEDVEEPLPARTDLESPELVAVALDLLSKRDRLAYRVVHE